jgi:hypothetical protein
VDLLSAAGLTVAQSGPVGIRNLHFALAIAPSPTSSAALSARSVR